MLPCHTNDKEMLVFCQKRAVFKPVTTKAPKMSDRSSTRPYRILLAEDDEVNQDIVRAYLADMYNVKLIVINIPIENDMEKAGMAELIRQKGPGLV